ncbi:MAG: endonuclease III [Candidatus Tyrphobacter sp.]
MSAVPFPKRKVSRAVALEQLTILERTYPRAASALEHRNPYELLIAVILSAQCTDARVNVTTPILFEKYPAPEKLAKASPKEVERIIKSCGFYHAKARNVIAAARDIAERFGGKVPAQRESLESLAGVGRKTASVVLANAFGEPALAVDTHVFRVAHRLGLTTGKTPLDVERDLTAVVPRKKWGLATHWLILHGRAICKAPRPLCDRCPLLALCPTGRALKKNPAQPPGPRRRGMETKPYD